MKPIKQWTTSEVFVTSTNWTNPIGEIIPRGRSHEKRLYTIVKVRLTDISKEG